MGGLFGSHCRSRTILGSDLAPSMNSSAQTGTHTRYYDINQRMQLEYCYSEFRIHSFLKNYERDEYSIGYKRAEEVNSYYIRIAYITILVKQGSEKV